MDNNELGQKPDLLTTNFVKVDDRSGENWRSAASWARTLAIIGVVFSILLVVFFGTFGSSFLQLGSIISDGYAIVIIVCTILLGILLLLLIPLLRFGNNVKQAVDLQDAVLFEKGITALKVFFIVAGILSGLRIFTYLINIVNSL